MKLYYLFERAMDNEQWMMNGRWWATNDRWRMLGDRRCTVGNICRWQVVDSRWTNSIETSMNDGWLAANDDM